MSDRLIFSLEGHELEAAKAWRRKHPCIERGPLERPATGERFIYEFMPTGMGVLATIRCTWCGGKQVVTDCRDW